MSGRPEDDEELARDLAELGEVRERRVELTRMPRRSRLAELRAKWEVEDRLFDEQKLAKLQAKLAAEKEVRQNLSNMVMVAAAKFGIRPDTSQPGWEKKVAVEMRRLRKEQKEKLSHQRSRNAALAAENVRLRAERDRLARKSADLGRNAARLLVEGDVVEAELAGLLGQLADEEFLWEEVRGEMADVEDDIDQLAEEKSRLDAEETDYDRLVDRRSRQLADQLADLQRSANSLRKRLAGEQRLDRDLDDAILQLNGWSADQLVVDWANRLRAELNKLDGAEERRDSVLDDVDQLDDQIFQLTSDAQQLADEYDRQLDGAEAFLYECDAQREEMQTAVETVSAEVVGETSRLQRAQKAAAREKKRLDDELDVRAGQIRHLADRNSGARENLARQVYVEGIRETRLRRKLDDVNAHLKGLTEQKSSASAQLRQLRSDRNSAALQGERVRDERDAAKSQLLLADQRQQQLRRDQMATRLERNAFRAEMKWKSQRVEEIFDELNAEVTPLRAEVARLDGRSAQQRREKERLREEKKAADQQNQQLSDAADRLRRQIDRKKRARVGLPQLD